ncbi:MAG: hypothetical protein AAGK66_06390 [Pseudomonadota bacterium]
MIGTIAIVVGILLGVVGGLASVFSSLSIAIFADRISWEKASIIIKSPLVRLAAVVPTLGYVVLYGDQFSSLLEFTKAFDGREGLFSASEKSRMLYYGGLLIFCALVVYLLRCPAICKRNDNLYEALDEYARIGTEKQIRQANIAAFHGSLTVKHDTQFMHAIIELSIALNDYFKTTTVKPIAPSTVNDDNNSPTYSHQSIRSILDDYNKYGLSLLDDEYHPEIVRECINFNIDNMRFFRELGDSKTVAFNLIEQFYAYQSRQRKFSAIIVLVLSITGTGLFGLPSVDIFTQILITDFTS